MKRGRLISTIPVFVFVAGCFGLLFSSFLRAGDAYAAMAPPGTVGTAPPTQTEPQAQNPLAAKQDGEIASDIQAKAVAEAATVYGMTGGWREEASRINKTLNANEHSFDILFSFTPFMLGAHVLAPAVDVENDEFDVRNAAQGTSYAKRYRVTTPAQVVSIPPNWRQYLLLAVPDPPKINKAILPKTPAQIAAWKKHVKAGWRRGAYLADYNETLSLRSLGRDIIGRIRYLRLLRLNVVQAPMWAVTDTGTQIGLQDMIVGSRLTMVTRSMRFNAPARWRMGLLSGKRAGVAPDKAARTSLSDTRHRWVSTYRKPLVFTPMPPQGIAVPPKNKPEKSEVSDVGE